MKALISSIEPRETGYRVAQVEQDENIFPVAEPAMFWVNFPPNLDPSLVPYDKYWYNPADQTISEIPLPPVVPPSAAQNQATAIQLLAETDWVNQPDVTNPDINPHLLNHSAFITYRSQVRAIAINPTEGYLDWPVKPDAQWSTP